MFLFLQVKEASLEESKKSVTNLGTKICHCALKSLVHNDIYLQILHEFCHKGCKTSFISIWIDISIPKYRGLKVVIDI